MRVPSERLMFRGLAFFTLTVLAGLVPYVGTAGQISADDVANVGGDQTFAISSVYLCNTIAAGNVQDMFHEKVGAAGRPSGKRHEVVSPGSGGTPVIQNAPMLTCTMSAPSELQWDIDAKDYANNPFTVTFSIFNSGDQEGKNATVTIEVDSADFVLVSPVAFTQPANPADIPDGQVATAAWQLKARPRITSDTVSIRISASFDNHKTIDGRMKMFIPAAIPNLSCSISGPDSLHVNASRTDVKPNPFAVTYTITNGGAVSTGITSIAAYFSNSSLALDSTYLGNTRTRDIQASLAPASSIAETFVFRALAGMQQRSVTIQFVAYDVHGNIVTCMHNVVIDSLPTALHCNASLDRQVFSYDSATQTYPQQNVTITATLTNIGSFILSDVNADLSLQDPEGYLEPDPNYTDDNPVTTTLIFQGQSATVTWHYRLAKSNTGNAPVYVGFSIDYWANEISRISDGCSTMLAIMPEVRRVPVKPPYTGPVSVPDTTQRYTGGGSPRGSSFPKPVVSLDSNTPERFALGQNVPNPFNPSTVITYALARDCKLKLVVYDILGRPVQTLVDGYKAAGEYRVSFNASGLSSGVYLYKLETPEYTMTKRMVLTR